MQRARRRPQRHAQVSARRRVPPALRVRRACQARKHQSEPMMEAPEIRPLPRYPCRWRVLQHSAMLPVLLAGVQAAGARSQLRLFSVHAGQGTQRRRNGSGREGAGSGWERWERENRGCTLGGTKFTYTKVRGTTHGFAAQHCQLQGRVGRTRRRGDVNPLGRCH